MDIKISVGWGRKGQHSLRTRNQELETQVGALTTALAAEQAENEELREQLKEALVERIKKGHRMNSVGLRLMKGPVMTPIEGRPNGYMIVEGGQR